MDAVSLLTPFDTLKFLIQAAGVIGGSSIPGILSGYKFTSLMCLCIRINFFLSLI